jgi:putative FmdB family regulatory protein
MPLYEYQCEACGERFEAIRKFSDPPLEVCEKCGKGPIQRLVSSPAFQFKGSGWYITDYAKKGSGSSTDSGTKDGSAAEKADSAAGDKASSDTASSDKPSSDKPSSGTESSKTETPAKPAASTTSKD